MEECDIKLYLTDTQYLQLLQKIGETVNQSNFRPRWEDSTEIGSKHTLSNCGLCNDDFTTPETAMFPSEFPQRKDMKYAQEHHKCPFDFRTKMGLMGCFYTCWFFKRHMCNITKIRQLVTDQLQKGINNAVKDEYK